MELSPDPPPCACGCGYARLTVRPGYVETMVELELRSDPAYCKYTDFESYTHRYGINSVIFNGGEIIDSEASALSIHVN